MKQREEYEWKKKKYEEINVHFTCEKHIVKQNIWTCSTENVQKIFPETDLKERTFHIAL